MASNTGADERDQNKPVTGYPSQAGQVATGYPRASPLVDSAYFYSPPPPSPYFAAVVSPASFYPPLRRSNSSFLLLLRLLSAMLFVFLLIGTIFFISWSVVRPRLPEFRVSSAFASPLNATSSDLSATLDLSIVVANPNTKFCILYDRIEASVFYRDGFLVSQSKLAPFHQAKLNQTLVSARMAIVGANVGNNVVKEVTIKIVESLRDDIYAGNLKSGSEIKGALKKCVLDLVTKKGNKTELQLGFRKPAVIIIVGVNGGGKTTSLGKLAHRLKKEGAKVLMAAGDTFRAAASDQLEIWAERTGCEIVVAEKEKAKASSVLSQAVKRGKEGGFDVVLCDTSGRLHTNYSLMEELIACKKAVSKVVPGTPNEILLVLDGTTGLNMLPQAREFNEVVGITGLILTKLDGSARGGCVVSVVDELGIPVKFVGVGEGVEDLQPFDAETFVDAVFS